MENETKRVSHSEVLKALMNDSDKSASEVSQSIGAYRAYVSNKAAKDNVRIETLTTIAAAYGYDLALIDRETGEPRYIIEPPK